jgi:hypothetical protein
LMKWTDHNVKLVADNYFEYYIIFRNNKIIIAKTPMGIT